MPTKTFKDPISLGISVKFIVDYKGVINAITFDMKATENRTHNPVTVTGSYPNEGNIFYIPRTCTKNGLETDFNTAFLNTSLEHISATPRVMIGAIIYPLTLCFGAESIPFNELDEIGSDGYVYSIGVQITGLVPATFTDFDALTPSA